MSGADKGPGGRNAGRDEEDGLELSLLGER